MFTRDGAVIFVYAERKKASTANAIIGFQPAADGSVSFTGQADLVLRNVLERGEQLEMLAPVANCLAGIQPGRGAAVFVR